MRTSFFSDNSDSFSEKVDFHKHITLPKLLGFLGVSSELIVITVLSQRILVSYRIQRSMEISQNTKSTSASCTMTINTLGQRSGPM